MRSNGAPHGKANGWSRAAEAYAAALFLLYAILVLAHAGAPSLTDYGNWTYQGVLLRNHLLGTPDPWHTLKHYPVPNSLTTVGIALLCLVLPWLLASKLWLVLQLVVCFAALRSLLRTLAAPAVAWLVLPQAVFLNVNLWYGFMNFELGLAWVLWFAAMLLRRRRGGRVPIPMLAALLVLAFFTHMIPFCFCCLLLLLYSRQTGQWRTLTAALPAVLLTVWYVLGRFLLAGNADGAAGMQESVRNYSAAFWAFKVNSYAKSFGFANPMGLDRAVFGRAGFAVLLCATALLACLAAYALVRTFLLTGRDSERRFLLLAVVLPLPLYLLAPGAALGISDPGARVLQVLLALGLALCFGSLGRLGRCVAGGSAVVLALGGAVMFSFYGGDRGTALQHTPAPTSAGRFAHVPSDDQDYFYAALNRGDFHLTVFPTALLLNKDAGQPPVVPGHPATLPSR